MDEIIYLYKYFPRKSFGDSVWGYVSNHLDDLQNCIKNELFESAYYHLHILYMSFLYMQIVRLAERTPKDIALSFTLLRSDEEEKIIKKLQDEKSPWVFAGKELSESKIPRFFRLIGLSDAEIRIIQDPIIFRNKRMHANGLRACENKEHFLNHCEKYLGIMDFLLEKQKEILIEEYSIAVAQFNEDVEYIIDDNDVEKYLETFSEREQEICAPQCLDRISKYIQDKIQENSF